MIAIVYATGSLLPRRMVSSDSRAELEAASAPTDGETRFLHPGLETIPVEQVMKLLGIERAEEVSPDHRLRAAILIETGAAEIPSGRCAVVLPDTREVIEFIVADPALDVVDKEHFLGGDQACELHASEDAKLGDKITKDGEWLARVVTGDREGKVEAVEWIAPEKIPEGYVEDSQAEPGDVIDALKLTDVNMGVKTDKFDA